MGHAEAKDRSVSLFQNFSLRIIMVNNSPFSVIFDMTSHCSNYNHYSPKDVKLSLLNIDCSRKSIIQSRGPPPFAAFSGVNEVGSLNFRGQGESASRAVR